MNLAADVTVVLTSCGRQDLLERTLDSFFAMNTYEGIAEILVTEDSGVEGVNDALKAKYADRPLVWIDDEGRRGQIACIDDAYARVRTPLVFHCEDDWHFYHPGFIEASKAILAHDDRILQVWLRAEDDTNGHPLDEPVFEAPFGEGRVRYRHLALGHWGVWHGFSFNPGLRRLADYRLVAPFRDVGHEADLSIRYRAEGFRAVLLLRDDGGGGFVEHTGGGRHVDDLRIEPAGGSTGLEHLGGYFVDVDPATWMPDIWGFLALTFGIRSVIDVGAGMGHNVRWWHDLGFEACGVEGHPDALAQSPVRERLVAHDYAKGPYDPGREFDLAICTEFVAHVEQRFEANWLATLRRCKHVLMSHGYPGQGGYHHVNEQTTEYWIDRFAENGFACDWSLSEKFRATNARRPAGWGRPTLLFFVRER